MLPRLVARPDEKMMRFPSELVLAKHFYAGERVNMELRMEFFNVLNRMQVCSPDATVTDGANNFGFVQPNGSGGSSPCQANTPRQGQAYFKISF